MSAGPEVVVVGGGPAGAAAARLLALWDRRVLLVTGPSPARNDLAESLPPTIRKLLEAFRVTQAVEQAGFHPARGNTVWWPGDRERVTEFPDGPGWQVRRRRFDALLLELAEAAGVEVRHGAVVDDVTLRGGGARVRIRGSTSAEEVAAPFVLDCSGRAGVVAGKHRVPCGEVRTNALIGSWRRPGGWGLPDESHTLVEGYRDGWAWSIPVDPEVRYFTVMVDPAATALARDGRLETMYRAELAKTSGLQGLLGEASPADPMWACGATPYGSRRMGGPGFLLVGDAASFIDPLSSYGVKKALASAWLASVVANTLLDEPEMERDALAFYEERERAAYRSYLARAAEFYREGASVHDHPFWHHRADLAPEGVEKGAEAEHLVSGSTDDPDVDALRLDPGVQKAFQGLKEASRVRLRPAGPTTLVRAPAVQERRIVLKDRLSTPSHPEGIRYLRGVDVVVLVRLATTLQEARTDVPGLYQSYERAAGPVALPDFLGALSVLLAEGVLVNEARDPERAPASRAPSLRS